MGGDTEQANEDRMFSYRNSRDVWSYHLFIHPRNPTSEWVREQISIWKNEQASDGDEEITQKSAQREKQTENRLRFSDMESRTNWSNKHVIGIPEQGTETEDEEQYFI